MTAEHLIKRTVFVWKCECGETDMREASAPKERLCKCGKWAPYVEQSVIGPNLNLPGYAVEPSKRG